LVAGVELVVTGCALGEVVALPDAPEGRSEGRAVVVELM
jgi:hypothetical protein